MTTTFDAAAYDLRERHNSFRRSARSQGLALTEEVDADLATLAAWGERNRARPAAALSAYLTGVDVDQAIAAAELGSARARVYLDQRRSGTDHYDAYLIAAATHVCDFTVTKDDRRNPVLGTGDVVTTLTCECGNTRSSRTTQRWSGD